MLDPRQPHLTLGGRYSHGEVLLRTSGQAGVHLRSQGTSSPQLNLTQTDMVHPAVHNGNLTASLCI